MKPYLNTGEFVHVEVTLVNDNQFSLIFAPQSYLCTDLGTLIQTFIEDMLLLKDPQFLPNDYETRSKFRTHEYFIQTEFRNHWVKIVDF